MVARLNISLLMLLLFFPLVRQSCFIKLCGWLSDGVICNKMDALLSIYFLFLSLSLFAGEVVIVFAPIISGVLYWHGIVGVRSGKITAKSSTMQMN